MEMSQKRQISIVGREKERLGEKDSGERGKWVGSDTDPSDEWTDGQTDRQISERYVNNWHKHGLYLAML